MKQVRKPTNEIKQVLGIIISTIGRSEEYVVSRISEAKAAFVPL